jgi:cobalt-zinc-cadmium efflux system membrane fusion protein
MAQPGETVSKGAPLATLASSDAQQAFSDLRKAEALFAAAEKEQARQRELFAVHAGAQRDLETAESNFSQARAELERAQGKVQVLGSPVDSAVTQEYVLHSPIDGEVIARNVNPGVEVVAGGGVELFTVGKMDRVWVLADVFEVDLAKVKKDASVAVKFVGYPDKIFQGTVDWVSGALDPTSRTVKVRCALANAEHYLRPEMYASVAISTDGHRALAVPRSAVLRLGDQTVSFVEKGRTPEGKRIFERRLLTVNDDGGGDFLPIVKGLVANERVVTTGAILLAGMI